MEKLIILYCILILVLIGVILCSLLFVKNQAAQNALSLQEKVLFACGGLIGLLILHLNWLLLPWSREQKGDVVAFSSTILLTLLLFVPIFFLFLQKPREQDL
ncbi:hypothetical protein ACFSC6_20495 [Rufibacter sediminis]|uniref:Uncharacterized protein n=1 Tax=Rufibacter sediminis TaxID=2762756 RepID=A0ABR6VNR6_9BACT|nr:hypothetical protein [Rufibacter sediminis]MBC3538831.1 hypothetical protein [Rufibacter sediminis]